MIRTEILAFQSVYYVIVHGILFLLLSFQWLERKLKERYFPIILIIYTFAMVGGSWMYLLEPSRGITHFISQSYSLVPILLVPVVFIAWQYDYRAVVVYTVITNLSDLIISYLIVRHIAWDTLPVLGLPIIRSFAFGLVGFLVSQLNERQKEQKHKLILANIQLGQYANTLESLATSRERNRLARELHDTLAHTLSGISVNLEALKTFVPEGNDEVQRMLDSSLLAAQWSGRHATHSKIARPAFRRSGAGTGTKALLKAWLSARISITLITPLTHILPPNVEQAFIVSVGSVENVALHANAATIFLTLVNLMASSRWKYVITALVSTQKKPIV